MKNDFEQLLERRYNGSMKWESEYIKKRFHVSIDHQDKFYPLFIADMDFCMDKNVQNRLIDFVQKGDFGYFHIQDSFYDSIIHWYEDIHQEHIKKQWLTATCGTITSMHLLCDCFSKGKNILLMTPIYGPFQNCANRGHAYHYALHYQDGRYHICFEELETILQSKSIHTLLLCNPHNPGGISWSHDELEQLVLLCKKYDIYIFSDEIHGDLQISKNHMVSLVHFFEKYDKIVVCSSPNKTFNISGLSTSYTICGCQAINEQLNTYLASLHLGVQRLGIYAIECVYTYGKQWYYDLLEYLKRNMNMTISYLSQYMEVMLPDAGYLIWVRLPKVKDVDKFVMDLAKDTLVLVETGSRFVDNYQGWIRINTATQHDLLQEAMEKLVNYYQEYKGE